MPKPLAGNQVYDWVKDILTIFGRTQKKDASEKNIWKKMSLFFDLLYWFDLNVRHCIDVMHVKKNVCDSLMGTLLNIKGNRMTSSRDAAHGQRRFVRQKLRPAFGRQSRA